jgi:putative ABC transport system permease protein
MTDVVAVALASPRLTGSLLSGFAGIALLLAATGIYGVLAYRVAQRTHELGIRMAVGADRGHVLRIVVGQGVALASAGIGLGLVAALRLARLMRSLLYEVEAADPMTFVLVPALLAVVAVAASAVPAVRATRVSPVVALRAE